MAAATRTQRISARCSPRLLPMNYRAPRRGAHFRGAMASSEVWSVRRAKEAGEALRPSRANPRTTTPSDRPRPSLRGAPSPRATTTTSSSGAPIGTVVGLVVARERVAAVYCKRTGETVPRASITLADDTFDGLRVVLWRTHAGADVGARPSPNCWHPPESQPAQIVPRPVPHLSPIHPQASATSYTPVDSARDGTPTPSDPRRPRDGARASPSSPPPATSSAIPTILAAVPIVPRRPPASPPASTRDAPPAPRTSLSGPSARTKPFYARSRTPPSDV